MKDYGKVTNVYVFDEDRIAIDFEDATICYSKGNSWYNLIYIEPVTGMERHSTIGLPNRAEFLDNLLEILVEANIKKQLEKAPLDKIVTIFSGEKSVKCEICDRKAVEFITKRLLKELKGQIQVVGDIEFEVLSPYLSDDYLDALRYAYQDMAAFGTGVVKLPNGSSVAFGEPDKELEGLTTDFYFDWDNIL